MIDWQGHKALCPLSTRASYSTTDATWVDGNTNAAPSYSYEGNESDRGSKFQYSIGELQALGRSACKRSRWTCTRARPARRPRRMHARGGRLERRFYQPLLSQATTGSCSALAMTTDALTQGIRALCPLSESTHLRRFRRVGYAVPHGTDGTRVTTNLGLWERNAIYGRNANVRRLGGCV